MTEFPPNFTLKCIEESVAFTVGNTYVTNEDGYVIDNDGHPRRFITPGHGLFDYPASTLDQSKVETPVPHDRIKTASDGGSTGYYKLPLHATELRHLISHKGMSKARGDVFKACYRLGEKQGVDALYDLNKMKFFVEDLIEMYHRGEHL